MIKSLAIGSFDGIHLAHQELIKRADGVLVIERGIASLTPGWKRSLYTNKPTFFYFLENIKSLTPKEFINKLSQDFPNLEKIVVGYDFNFGKNREGSIESLKELFNGKVEVVPEVKLNGISIHSRVIREYIINNQIDIANKMLNRAYRIDGEHIKGLGIGSKELVPTINLQVKNYTLPNGVFASKTYIEDKRYNAVTFVGHRESLDNSFTVEIHILEEFTIEIKNRVWVEFLEFIRETQKFNSLQELKKQIFTDIKKAKDTLKLKV